MISFVLSKRDCEVDVPSKVMELAIWNSDHTEPKIFVCVSSIYLEIPCLSQSRTTEHGSGINDHQDYDVSST